MNVTKLIKPPHLTESIHTVEPIQNLKELLHHSCSNYSDHVAFRYKEKVSGTMVSKTYADFQQDVNALGTALLEQNFKNERIMVISSNRYEWCVTYLATVNGVGTIIPIDRELPPDEITTLVNKSEPNVIFFEEKFLDLFVQLKEQKVGVIQKLVCFDLAEDTKEVSSFSRLLEEGKHLLDNGNRIFLDTQIDSKASTIMIYTSGTTSKSKCVLLSPYNIASDVVACAKVVHFKDTDVLLSFLPIHHTFECTATFFLGLYCGACIAFCDGMKSIVPNLKEYDITIFLAVPLILEMLYKGVLKTSAEKNLPPETVLRAMAPHLRLFIVGAASIDKEIVSGLNKLGIDAYQGYGLTEASPVVSVENDKERRPGSIGKLLPGIEGKIVNPDEEGVGEIVIKGPTIMEGYYDNKEATDSALQDGWLYTGDLGYFDQDGFLYITGRKKSVIVLKNGKNVFPEEIEAVINNSPLILESFVYSTKHRNSSDQLCAKIVYNQEYLSQTYGSMTEEDKRELILRHIKQINKNLPLYKYIRDITLTTEPLIKTTTNKIKRYEELKRTVS